MLPDQPGPARYSPPALCATRHRPRIAARSTLYAHPPTNQLSTGAAADNWPPAEWPSWAAVITTNAPGRQVSERRHKAPRKGLRRWSVIGVVPHCKVGTLLSYSWHGRHGIGPLRTHISHSRRPQAFGERAFAEPEPHHLAGATEDPEARRADSAEDFGWSLGVPNQPCHRGHRRLGSVVILLPTVNYGLLTGLTHAAPPPAAWIASRPTTEQPAPRTVKRPRIVSVTSSRGVLRIIGKSVRIA